MKRADIRVPAKVAVDPGPEMVRVRTPATQPAATYRLTRQTVAGTAPMQWVFIIVTPEGYPWVGTAEKLRWMIEQAVPAGATLEWNVGCKRIGGEPLDTVQELDALKAFCTERNVKFEHIPAG